eukprot:IDg695t1
MDSFRQQNIAIVTALLMTMMLLVFVLERVGHGRSRNVIRTHCDFWQLSSCYDDITFRRAFRLNRQTFSRLLDTLRPTLIYPAASTSVNRPRKSTTGCAFGSLKAGATTSDQNSSRAFLRSNCWRSSGWPLRSSDSRSRCSCVSKWSKRTNSLSVKRGVRPSPFAVVAGALRQLVRSALSRSQPPYCEMSAQRSCRCAPARAAH